MRGVDSARDGQNGQRAVEVASLEQSQALSSLEVLSALHFINFGRPCSTVFAKQIRRKIVPVCLFSRGESLSGNE